MAPWLIAILIDLFLYVFRQVWHWVPVWGGRAQGRTRPRPPSLKDARRRTLSLADIMGSGSPGRVREEGFRRRHGRNTSDKSMDGAVGEDPATPDGGIRSEPVS
ncbi:hypothetical protein EPUS_00077 [Endocarpon pusillum Z07020]|uniref:Uncharacterized protein n=1 Tax=Endocarpon pusillum (strain Z07020 / HMAS-L-300199) TaxID=1263415 RepID=U1HWX0_ENDPU|nr:uncharacterized protein EPUS_00077 [Endocarpon pusillum Z07020]ERF75285.1 hypothetical protein EPUS_00077 [Endocarpon pusillum Z07020]